jgi:hypothetical protein
LSAQEGAEFLVEAGSAVDDDLVPTADVGVVDRVRDPGDELVQRGEHVTFDGVIVLVDQLFGMFVMVRRAIRPLPSGARPGALLCSHVSPSARRRHHGVTPVFIPTHLV